jgi:hypothetical protein
VQLDFGGCSIEMLMFSFWFQAVFLALFSALSSASPQGDVSLLKELMLSLQGL